MPLRDSTPDPDYECTNCGSEWRGAESIAYATPVCATCGALETEAKEYKQE